MKRLFLSALVVASLLSLNASAQEGPKAASVCQCADCHCVDCACEHCGKPDCGC